jgi:hypothetical protein
VAKGAFQTVGDKEHAEIIRLSIEEDWGIGEIAQKLDWSIRTPHTSIHTHNESVARSGFCAPCKRINDPYQSVIRKRQREGSTCDCPTATVP